MSNHKPEDVIFYRPSGINAPMIFQNGDMIWCANYNITKKFRNYFPAKLNILTGEEL